MSKRKPPRLRLLDMPQLIDSIAVDIRNLPEAARAMSEVPSEAKEALEMLSVESVEASYAAQIRALDDAQLWWISESMALLAQAASHDIPDWDFEAVRPAPSGVIIWEGSTGIREEITGFPYADSGGAIVQGLFWWTEAGATVVGTLIRAADSSIPTPSQGLSVGVWSWMPNETEGTTIFDAFWKLPGVQRLHALLGATLILAQQPTIVTRHTRVGGQRMLAARPHLPVTVTQVVLRESVKDAARAQVAESESKWHLKTRFLVRGHWREQPVGPGRELRRPTYIAPYIKGPDDAPLNLTREVNVWRR